MTSGAHFEVGPGAGRLRARLVAAALCALSFVAVGWAQASREYDLKAVFLYNFATFVDWPETAFADPDSPIVIGVLGEDPFGAALDEVVANEKVKGRPLEVRRCATIAEGKACHILFISSSERENVRAVLRETSGRPILTVADLPRFVDAGGMVGFATGPRLQLHVNATAARNSGLIISSKLLRVAVVREYASLP